MSAFLKATRRGASWLVNNSGNSLHAINNAHRWLTKSLHTTHNGYRSIKNEASRALPGADLAIMAIEQSPVGRFVNAARGEASNYLNLAGKGLKAANRFEEQVNPGLRKFINES